MRYSKQRSVILDIVKSNPVHPTAEWVYKQAQKKIPSIGIATVYRNLNALSDSGLIEKIPGSDGVDRFDADIAEHYHMQCECCGNLIDLRPRDSESMEKFHEVLVQTFGIADEHVSVSTTLLKGRCDDCMACKKN